MFDLAGLALTFGLCPLPLTCPTVKVVHLAEIQIRAPLEAVTRPRTQGGTGTVFILGPCTLPSGVVLRSETEGGCIRQLPRVPHEQDLAPGLGGLRCWPVLLWN